MLGLPQTYLQRLDGLLSALPLILLLCMLSRAIFHARIVDEEPQLPRHFLIGVNDCLWAIVPLRPVHALRAKLGRALTLVAGVAQVVHDLFANERLRFTAQPIFNAELALGWATVFDGCERSFLCALARFNHLLPLFNFNHGFCLSKKHLRRS